MYEIAKRAVDVVSAAVLLVLLSPVLAAIAIAVRLCMGAPVMFRQLRPGRGGVPFTLVKFRTMADARDRSGELLPDASRLTALGRLLRRTSLDELPELFNVLAGEMSLVGPRPLLMEYLDRYTPEQHRRHEVRPGITGWAQVNGRNALTWDDKFALDVWYVDHRSLRLDFEILGRTLREVVGGRGVSAPGHETMEPFQGERVMRVIVIGGSDQGRQVIDAIDARGDHTIVGVLDRAIPTNSEVSGYPVLGGDADLRECAAEVEADGYVVAIGDNFARGAVLDRADAECADLTLITVAHPTAVMARDAVIGAGSILLAGSVVSNGCELGRGVLLGTRSSIDHDGHVDEHASLGPGATTGGNVTIGARTAVGLGAAVIHGITIGADTVVGAGAVVLADVPGGVVAYGLPATVVRPRGPGQPYL